MLINENLSRIANNLVDAADNRGHTCVSILINRDRIHSRCHFEEADDLLHVINELMTHGEVSIEQLIQFQIDVNDTEHSDM